MAWWDALAPQQEQRVKNPIEEFVDPTRGPLMLDGLMADPAQAEPGLRPMNILPPPARAVGSAGTGLSLFLKGLQMEKDAARSGQLMGGEIVPVGQTARIGRQGQTIEGELATAGSAPPGLPAPMTGGRTAGQGGGSGATPSGGRSMMDEWVDDLIMGSRGRGETPPGGGSTPPPGGGGKGAPSPGGPGRTSLSVAGTNIPMSLRALLPTWLGGGDAAEMPPIEVPESGFIGALAGDGAGAESDFALGPEVNTPRQDLPQIDYENLTNVPYEEMLAKLAETRPEAPKDQSFLQNLDEWLIPAIAGGLLGGLPGVVLGGLVGEGGRQDRVAGRERQYGEDVREFERGLAEATINMLTGQRSQELETQQGNRQQALGNFEFDLTQDQADREATSFGDQRQLRQLEGQLAETEMAALNRQQQLRQLMLSRGVGGQNNAAVLQRIAQTNPQLMTVLSSMPEYEQYVLNAQENGDPFIAEANLAQMLRNLQEQSPEAAQLIQQLQQEQMLQSLLK